MDYILSDLRNHFSYSYMTSSGYIAICIMVVFFLAVILLIPGRKMHDRVLLALFFGLMFGVYSLTVLMRGSRAIGRSFSLMPFNWYTVLKNTGNPNLAWLALENCLMLMFPAFLLGIIIRNVRPFRRIMMVTLIMAAFSLTIEYTQLGLNIGVFEMDDFLCNTLGAFVGVLIAMCVTATPAFKSMDRRVPFPR